MTLAELLDLVLRNSGLRDSDRQTEIIEMLNAANDEMSRDLLIPEYTVDMTGITGSQPMPSNARTGGLISVRRQADGTPYDILTNTKADRLHPGWLQWDPGDTAFIVYDPATAALVGNILPVPIPVAGDTVDFTVAYVAKPSDMTDLTDKPFDGLLPEFHRMLAYKVVYELLLEVGDQRRSEFYAKYSKMMAEALTYSRPQTVLAKHAIVEGNADADDSDD